jgi:hypothetical protein
MPAPADVTGALLARKGAASPAGFKDPPAQPPQPVGQEPRRPGSRRLMLWIFPTAIVAIGVTLAAQTIMTPTPLKVAVIAPLKIKPATIETPVIQQPAPASEIPTSEIIKAPKPPEPKQLAVLQIAPVEAAVAEPAPTPPAPKIEVDEVAVDQVAVKVAIITPVKVQTQTVAKPVYRVQLHALGSRATARRAWRKIKNSHDDLFGQKQMTLLSGRNKASGARFVRLQAGPFNGFRDARNLCTQAIKRRLSCVVVQQ